MHGASTLRLVNLTTGTVLASHPLPTDAFGEGLTRLPARGARRERLLQLTWLSGRAFVYDAADLKAPVNETRTLLGDGWGAAFDPTTDRVVLSDGSSSLAWVHAGDPGGALLRHVSVKTPGGALVPNLNELEWVAPPTDGSGRVGGSSGPSPLPTGEIWANVWGTPCVARIDPASGSVVGWILGDALATRAVAAAASAPTNGPPLDVMNGVAVDPATGRVLMTGKNWPLLFDVMLSESGAPDAAARAAAVCVPARASFGR